MVLPGVLPLPTMPFGFFYCGFGFALVSFAERRQRRSAPRRRAPPGGTFILHGMVCWHFCIAGILALGCALYLLPTPPFCRFWFFTCHFCDTFATHAHTPHTPPCLHTRTFAFTYHTHHHFLVCFTFLQFPALCCLPPLPTFWLGSAAVGYLPHLLYTLC